MEFLKRLFGKKGVSSLLSEQELIFLNVENYLNSDKINEVTDSKSTAFFKEAVDIVMLDEMENENVNENDLVLLPEEEEVLFSVKES